MVYKRRRSIRLLLAYAVDPFMSSNTKFVTSFSSTAFILILSACNKVSAAAISDEISKCRVGQMNQTYEESRDAISRIRQNHTRFMEDWWHWCCDLEPWERCASQCNDRDKHLEDPFKFCFSETRQNSPPRES
jgi:hypothetical protein